MDRGDHPAIVARGIVKRFEETVALDGLDLEVPSGSVLGLLGPNGSGKTTLVRVLTTLTPPDEGTAAVEGHDVVHQAAAVRRRIGLAGQFSAVDDHLTGYENLEMAGRLYHLDRQTAARRARELLERFQLSDAASRLAKGYSGGMRRRLDLAASLVAHPSVLFLDEPTTGLDPRSRLDLWGVIRDLVRDGTTLLLTTQYLEEADQLADSIVVIDQGRVIAKGTAPELKSRVGGDVLTGTFASATDLERARRALAPLAAGDAQEDPVTNELRLPVGSMGSRALLEAVRLLDNERVEVLDLAINRPSLDDVFLALTGHAASNAPAVPTKRRRRGRQATAASLGSETR
ncbi:MAG: ATP-binding cassette domain-containing protein [Actinomycetota bacterium]|jgi:ABC-2 type transport system ATP-binding protein|nr:ATP-binding cassette domain-containing protein [Actinomycetota bacterium]